MKTKKIFMVKVNGYWLGWGGEATEFSEAKVYQGNPDSVVERLLKHHPHSSIEVFEVVLEEKHDRLYVSNLEEMLRDKKLNDLLN
jgi:hypothetical protein